MELYEITLKHLETFKTYTPKSRKEAKDILDTLRNVYPMADEEQKKLIKLIGSRIKGDWE